jgi:2OG-Fe(II) oxygenase superfamily
MARVTNSTLLEAPYLVIDDFMPSGVAQEMRAAVEAHLGNPYQHSPKTHMDWDYWYVPGLYTYLRTLPEKVIGLHLTELFHDCLFKWSGETLGLRPARASYLSLYVSGCRQNQHNDSTNGRFGFVYSLTNNSRRTTGGETLIWREDDYFETRINRPCSGSDFFQSIEPRFNRLVVFDDRMPHAVQLVEGNMDPLEGRIVIHGHIREAGPIVYGPLPRELVLEIADKLASGYSTDLGNALMIYHGPATVRFTVQPDGTVVGARVILNRVRRLRGEGPEVHELLAELVCRISNLRFPGGTEETIITMPFGFG